MTPRLSCMLVVTAALALASWPAGGQVVFRARADAVTIDVAVMDGRKPQTTLTTSDFVLTDAGVTQTLLDAGREEYPLDVTLTIDVSGSVRPDQRAAIERAVRQVSSALRADDRVSVVSFGRRVVEDRPLDRPPVPTSLSLAPRTTDGTSFTDALLLSLVTTPSLGRRQLNLFLTDAIDTSSFFDAAIVREAMTYASGQTSIVLVRRGGGLGKGAVRDLLTEVTSTSGGQIVELDADESLSEKFLAAIEQFRTSYLLRYIPTGVPRSGWHPVVVTVPTRSFQIRARQGYWAR